MKNKKLSLLISSIGFITISLSPSFITTIHKEITKTTNNDFQTANDNIVPVSYLNISNEELVGWATGVDNASLDNYDTIEIPADVQRLNDSCFYTLFDGSYFNNSTITKVFADENS